MCLGFAFYYTMKGMTGLSTTLEALMADNEAEFANQFFYILTSIVCSQIR